MSSPMNNTLPVQNITTSSNSAEFINSRQGSSSMTNAMRSQRPQHEQTASSYKGRSGRGRTKQSGFTNRSDNVTNRAIEKTTQDPMTLANPIEDGSGTSQINVGTSNDSVGRVRGYKSSGTRNGTGKYRQRQHANRLLSRKTDSTGIDIDLLDERITPGSSGRVAEIGMGHQVANSRKVNLSHLKFERKQHRGSRYRPSFNDNNMVSYNRNVVSHYRDPGTFHKFSKQQFLQANCQFVVLDGHDYTVHKADPDWPVDWDCIEEVRFKQSASTETTCPICLEPPVAAKITRCGHIYCWTCMLHYLSLSDENCRQCPICFEPVYKGDLRSVVSHIFMSYSVEEEIVMRLMIRKKGCVEVEPYRVESSLDISLPLEQSSNINRDHYYSQDNLVIVDSLIVVTKIAQRERDELLKKLEIDRNEPEVCFIEQAISSLQARVKKLHQNTTNGLELRVQDISGREKRAPPASNSDSSKSYLFYQCSDGQHIYLNPFSTKALCQEYNNLENCPLEIRAKVLQMDWISMSEAWRKRFRYLEHLPLTCEFRLIEIDFEKSNLISRETYRLFEDQIKMSEQERERRRREERKREKIIQVEQNRRIYGIQPSLKINLDNIDQFPLVSDERYLGLSQPKNQSRIDQTFSSDDEQSDEVVNVSRNSNLQQEYGTNVTDSEHSGDTIAEVALSFKDIQLQEAATATNSSKDNIKSANMWCNKKLSSTSTQSSFAQLLVNAKTSQKQWTRNIGSVSGANIPSVSHAGTIIKPHLTLGSDDRSEEIRALPSEFTISDFIDINVVSTAGKKKGKPKNSCRKGI